jgi:hypothetical protein
MKATHLGFCLSLVALAPHRAQSQILEPDVTFAAGTGVEVQSVLVASGGRTYVMLTTPGLDRIIRLHGQNGALISQIGTEVGADASLKRIVAGGLVSDSLWLVDGRKTIWFQAAPGKQSRRVTLDSIDFGGRRRAVTTIDRILDDGTLLVTAVSTDRNPQNPLGVVVTLFHVSQTGDVLHRLADEPLEFLNVTVDSGDTWRPAAMRTLDFFGSSQNGAFVVAAHPAFSGPDSAHVMITVRRATGERVDKVRLPFMPVPLSRGAIDSALITRGTRPAAAAVYRSMAPPIHQPVRSLSVGNDGSVLVAFRSDGPTRELVLLNRGSQQARFFLPAAEKVLRIDGAFLWARRPTPQGEEIVRYRMPVVR